MPHNYLHRIGQSIFPGGNPFYDEEDSPKIAALKSKMGEKPELKALYQSEIDAQKTHDMQEYMNIVATAGASGGGTAVSHGGAMPYGEYFPGDPRGRQPKPLSKEEDEYAKQLRAPGLATFSPYRMYR